MSQAALHYQNAQRQALWRVEGADRYSSTLWQLQRDAELAALAHHLQAGKCINKYIGIVFSFYQILCCKHRIRVFAIRQTIAPQAQQTCLAAGNIFALQKDHETSLKFLQKVWILIYNMFVYKYIRSNCDFMHLYTNLFNIPTGYSHWPVFVLCTCTSGSWIYSKRRTW